MRFAALAVVVLAAGVLALGVVEAQDENPGSSLLHGDEGAVNDADADFVSGEGAEDVAINKGADFIDESGDGSGAIVQFRETPDDSEDDEDSGNESSGDEDSGDEDSEEFLSDGDDTLSEDDGDVSSDGDDASSDDDFLDGQEGEVEFSSDDEFLDGDEEDDQEGEEIEGGDEHYRDLMEQAGQVFDPNESTVPEEQLVNRSSLKVVVLLGLVGALLVGSVVCVVCCRKVRTRVTQFHMKITHRRVTSVSRVPKNETKNGSAYVLKPICDLLADIGKPAAPTPSPADETTRLLSDFLGSAGDRPQSSAAMTMPTLSCVPPCAPGKLCPLGVCPPQQPQQQPQQQQPPVFASAAAFAGVGPSFVTIGNMMV